MAGKPNPPKEYAKEPTGRPSKFTPEIRASILDFISRRVPYKLAANASGVSDVTLYAWLEIAKDHLKNNIDSEYTIFLSDIKKAEANRVVDHLDKIASNIERWQGDAWILERRWHEFFGANVQLHELNERMSKIEQGELNGKENKERSKKDD